MGLVVYVKLVYFWTGDLCNLIEGAIHVKVVWFSYTRDAKGCQEMDDIIDSEFECPIFGDKAGHCGETEVVVE